MKFKINPNIIIRVPQFPIDSKLADQWEELKESIRLSSPSFYEVIGNVKADELGQLSPSIYHSIWKYFNRAKYRATPYGRFAGVGIIKKSNCTDGIIHIHAEQRLHSYICWTQKEILPRDPKKVDMDTLLLANSSYYKVGGNIRYLIFEDNSFHLAEIRWTKQLDKVLKAFSHRTSAYKVIKKLNLDDQGLLQEMVEHQLLYTNKEPNLIGQDYFEHVEFPQSENTVKYNLAEREVLKGYPQLSLIRPITELIKILGAIAPDPAEDRLADFKQNFARKYERKLVPIMKTLDPELGIGYGNLSGEISEKNLAVALTSPNRDDIDKDKFIPLYKILFNSLKDTSRTFVKLEELFDQQKNPTEITFSNTIGLLISIADEKVIFEQAYGPTATRLAGRFSLASKGIEDLCKETACFEKVCNPEVLFFDISYNAEIEVDNINRRKQIYPLQLSILNYDNSTDPILIDDLYLTLVGDELHLVSKSRNKRLIPRLATAYNYSRSDLSLYRLLCDMQLQGLKNNFDLRLPHCFPDMDYYPRVQYHNIIVSPAQWRLKFRDLEAQAHYRSNIPSLKNYLKSLNATMYLITRTEDRTLCFDTENDDDLKELFYLLKKYKSFLVEEGFIPKNPIVKDTEGNLYNSQLLLTLENKREIYKGGNYIFPEKRNRTNVPVPVCPPGSEWLYFEIFVHPVRSDELLKGKILGLLKANKEYIDYWFFVRYAENGEHLRLRIKMKSVEKLQPITSLFSLNFQALILEGIISDFRLATYKREIDRYGNDLLEGTEKHFSVDSEYVINLTRYGMSIMDKYFLCIELLLRIREVQIWSYLAFDQLIEVITSSFIEENHINGEGYRMLNSEFRVYQLHKPIPIPLSLRGYLSRFEQSLVATLNNSPKSKQSVYFNDLIHMHINRLFADHQRGHEMIIYYFLGKRIKQIGYSETSKRA